LEGAALVGHIVSRGRAKKSVNIRVNKNFEEEEDKPRHKKKRDEKLSSEQQQKKKTGKGKGGGVVMGYKGSGSKW